MHAPPFHFLVKRWGIRAPHHFISSFLRWSHPGRTLLPLHYIGDVTCCTSFLHLVPSGDAPAVVHRRCKKKRCILLRTKKKMMMHVVQRSGMAFGALHWSHPPYYVPVHLVPFASSMRTTEGHAIHRRLYICLHLLYTFFFTSKMYNMHLWCKCIVLHSM